MNISLNGLWKLNSDKFSNLDLEIPGSVLSCLLSNKLISDPFIGTNELKTYKYFKDDYSFLKTFNLSKDDLKKTNYLVILGIDTISKVYLNDEMILETKSMHMAYRVILNNLKEENTLKIIFKSPVNYINEINKKELFYSWGETMKYSPSIRKANYMFGWDWGPNLPDMGLYRDIYIESTDIGYLDEFKHEVKFDKDSALLNISLKSIKLNESKVNISLYYKDSLIKEEIDSLKEENNFNFIIRNPKLWYPSGYGDQNLYRINIKYLSANEVSEYNYNIGLRDIKIDDSKDQYGYRFQVYCNNIPIFLKGSDYIPMDNVLNRVNKESTYRLLKLAKDFNHNVIRVWGGGYYPDNYFYDICDELGLLVFEDYMFACGLYDTANKEFMDIVNKESLYTIKRIRHHASLLLMCGNNENEVAITSWKPYRREYAKKTFMELYLHVLKDITNNNSNLYYLESSPTSREPYFKDPNDYNNLDMHYWDVWHGYKPFEDYKTIYPRLLSEFGCQSFANYDTILTYAKEDELDIFSKVMMHHQKNKTCNDKILGYTRSLYKEAKDFKALVYLSQLAQAEGIKTCVEHLRRNMGRCEGVLYWQLNDCWPGQSWSSIDYYFGLKALHYYSKKFYNKFLVTIDYNKDSNEIYFNAINDDVKSHEFKIISSIKDFDGNIVSKFDDISINIDSTSQKEVFRITNPIKNKNGEIINLKFYVDDNEIDGIYYSILKPKELNLKKAKVSINLIDDYTLEVATNTYTKNIHINTHDNEIVLSDNFFDLLKGETKIITSNKKLNINDIEITNLKENY